MQKVHMCIQCYCCIKVNTAVRHEKTSMWKVYVLVTGITDHKP